MAVTPNVAPFINITFYVTGEYGVIRPTHTHVGVDLATSQTADLYSIFDGTVVEKGSSSARGYYIVIKGTNNLAFLYQHMASASPLNIGDNVLINNINLNIIYKDKICIIGNNGCGKSSLLKMIINNSSDNIKVGSNVKIGYIPQQINFKEDITILDYARKYFNGEESHLRSALHKFQFYGENVFKKVTKLSGGEKVRLMLFTLIHDNCNFIILDEPTNHIDISTKETLEDALINYEGTILFVSHDRYFINKLVNKVLYISDKNIIEYCGNYDYFMQHKK